MRMMIVLGVLGALFAAGTAGADDWPQLQHDARRTGYSEHAPGMDFHARWIWMGPDHILRNTHAEPDNPAFDDDLESVEGKNLPMPERVDFSLAESMQPIVADGRVFFADGQSTVYALDADTGDTLWQAELPGGSTVSGASDGRVTAFCSMFGDVRGYDGATGEILWTYDAGYSVTGAPALVDGALYFGDHGGRVHAVRLADGERIWLTGDLGGPIQGGVCVADGVVYTGAETVEAIALDAATGAEIARRKLMGQSFRTLWPVAAEGRVIFTTMPVICIGSEYVNDPVLSGDPDADIGWEPGIEPGYPDAAAEQQAVREWLAGDGRYWETTFALAPRTLEKDYIVAPGVTEGCGAPPNPPTLDRRGRPMIWWASARPSLVTRRAFGTNFSTDISAFDLATGDRILIDNGQPATGQQAETDNLYAMSVGGPFLYLRQNFRGTSVIDLENSVHKRISAQYRHRDGGSWPSPIVYAQGERHSHSDFDVRVPRSPRAMGGRSAPAIAYNRLYWNETFGITCAQPKQEDR